MILKNPKFQQTNKVTSGNYNKQIFIFKKLEVFGKHHFSSEAYKENIEVFLYCAFSQGIVDTKGRRDAQAGEARRAGMGGATRRQAGRGATRRQAGARRAGRGARARET